LGGVNLKLHWLGPVGGAGLFDSNTAAARSNSGL
jgi:hypothetical protein